MSLGIQIFFIIYRQHGPSPRPQPAGVILIMSAVISTPPPLATPQPHHNENYAFVTCLLNYGGRRLCTTVCTHKRAPWFVNQSEPSTLRECFVRLIIIMCMTVLHMNHSTHLIVERWARLVLCSVYVQYSHISNSKYSHIVEFKKVTNRHKKARTIYSYIF